MESLKYLLSVKREETVFGKEFKDWEWMDRPKNARMFVEEVYEKLIDYKI
jgi:hypothetical protein